MIDNIITLPRIQLAEQVANWQEAVHLAAKPLEQDDTIKTDYADAIIHSTEENGPYYVLAPGIALPHSRPEHGVNKMGLSLLKLNEGVRFGVDDKDPVKLLIVLAATDADSHVDAMTALSELLTSKTDMMRIMAAHSAEQIQAVLSRY